MTDKIQRAAFRAFLVLFTASQACFFAVGGAGVGALSDTSAISGGGVTAWVAASRLALEISNELLCFAMVALAIALPLAFARATEKKSAYGTAALAVLSIAVPVMAVMMIAQGRMAYPIAGLVPGEDILAFLHSVYLGCQHVLFLDFAALAIMAAFHAQFPVWFRVASIPAAVMLALGAYSWLMPAAFNLAVLAVFLGYGALGLRRVGV